jgi:hypothetical protein
MPPLRRLLTLLAYLAAPAGVALAEIYLLP